MEPPRFLLIDGHSLIHAWDELRVLHVRRGELRFRAREELLKQMRTLQDMTSERVVVVFDGTQSKLTDEREDGGVQVFYADAGHTADSVIERLAAKYAGTYALRVCTADKMIWEGVRASGALWISPLTLRDELARAEQDLRRRIGKRR